MQAECLRKVFPNKPYLQKIKDLWDERDDYIEDIGWNRLGLHPNKMVEVMANRDVWWLNLELLPRIPHEYERVMKEEKLLENAKHYSICDLKIWPLTGKL